MHYQILAQTVLNIQQVPCFALVIMQRQKTVMSPMEGIVEPAADSSWSDHKEKPH